MLCIAGRHRGRAVFCQLCRSIDQTGRSTDAPIGRKRTTLAIPRRKFEAILNSRLAVAEHNRVEINRSPLLPVLQLGWIHHVAGALDHGGRR